ncbi:hypothetical protein ACHAWO_012403 [Cyclotella atomus]|jgi:WD40 repeat protein|uniref:EIPR1-like beta-propeller domain-containing protein n=1 Tax=Cyclotella atomus TaxID=382360 RepID=A0ABD3MZ64_9STRA
MFSSQSIDYSLSIPTRCLASLPSRSPSAKPPPSSPTADENDQDGWGDDDSLQFDDALNEDTHRFLVGTAHPSISKPDDNEASEDEENNQLHVLSYHEDSHEITLDASYPHPNGEVWAMAPHPKNETVVTCGGGVYLSGEEGAASGSKLMEFKTVLWKMSNGDDEDFGLSSGPTLEPLITIPHGESAAVQTGWEKRVGCILWSPALSSDDSFDEQEVTASLLTVGWDASSPISLWDLSASCAVETWSYNKSTESGRSRYNLQSALPRRASWDPHEPTNILCTENQDIIAYDTRSAAGADGVGVIQNAHRYGVTSVDHNRLQEHVVVTSGMDGVVKFWDLRMHLSSRDDNCLPPAKILKTVRGGHSHWVTRASYNPFYDQLVLSGGTDGIANLWRISSCSSAPLLDFADDEEVNNSGEDANEGDDDGGDGNWAGEQEAGSLVDPVEDEHRDEEKKEGTSSKPSSNDIRVSRYECSDTTADVCWSASDPWMYATLSCDGSLAVHHVPSKEKYKILL